MTQSKNILNGDEERPQASYPQEPSWLTELRRQLSQSEEWATRLQRLYEDFISINRTTGFAIQDEVSADFDLDCDDCENLLDLYITDELEGSEVKSSYPLVWDHLQVCYRCQQAYHALTEILTLMHDGEKLDHSLLPSVPDFATQYLSFLEPQSKEAPWSMYLQSQIAGASFKITFLFNKAYLQTLFLPPISPAVRTEDAVSTPLRRLLLHQMIPMRNQNLNVEVVVIRSVDRPDNLVLQGTLTGLAQLPPKLRAQLAWSDQTLSAPVDTQGQVDFGEISLVKLKNAIETGMDKFEITFEVKESVNDVGDEGG